ncbi:MAG: GalNAc-alpha-(1-_4)-GalNAc-alpha-(1-_3)-diNAcBac-PP-undecaprenol alpha-1,4-N-acetyl-D-galactosaminyltransferase [Bacteroidetes bacterium ADurb.Bin145]|jgi:glycosyltransferase involved in cell wall biosynthesis|nr:MAG: GalNAc-alpha-(1->4)-GalNAc-alpha-(1->3)-diNAcBac-PP-undecaprenol alpha-1,4-N-acetyl-D-galactosaminyltransferase [Bacteroidetes bacterium ADurb.Bin145]
MGKKKLCLVIPSLQAGGMERVMSELAHYFAAREEIEVHLVLYGITREIFYPIPDSILISIPRFRFNNRWRLWCTIKTICFLRNEIKRIKPDSILSFGEYWNSFVLLSVLGLKYPVFVSDRSQPDKSLGWFHDTLRHVIYPTARGVICQTERAKEIFLSRNKHSNIVVIGNPIKDLKTISEPNQREKTVLMVGRLIKSKHQDKLIEMFAKVSFPDWKLIIVGYDHLKQHNMLRLKELARNLGVEQRVVFPGKQENVETIYSKSSIFAFTSSSEGFPNAIGEAMSAGLPVVAFDCIAGPSEMITDGYNGFLVPLFDFKQFEERLVALMNDESLRSRLGSNAKESIKKYSSETICKAFYKFVLQYDSDNHEL